MGESKWYRCITKRYTTTIREENRDAIWDGNQYGDDILMSILEDESRNLKNKKDIW